jgi:hypothetical protein
MMQADKVQGLDQEQLATTTSSPNEINVVF